MPQRDWDSVDWSQGDAAIALQLHCTRQRVYQVRKARGEPSPERRSSIQYSRLNQSAGHIAQADAQREGGRTFKVVITAPTFRRATEGMSYAGASRLRRELVGRGVNIVRESHPWEMMNFAIPNYALERIWGLPFNSVASYRNKHGLGRSEIANVMFDVSSDIANIEFDKYWDHGSDQMWFIDLVRTALNLDSAPEAEYAENAPAVV